MARFFGWFLIVAASLAGIADYFGWQLPTIGWIFEVTRGLGGIPSRNYSGGQIPWVSWLITIVIWSVGVWLVLSFSGNSKFSPLTLRRIKRFKEIKRGYWSLIIILVLGILAALDFIVVGSEALAVRYQGNWSFPAFTSNLEKGTDYGMDPEEEGATGPPDYRELAKEWKSQKSEGSKNLIIFPLWRYDATGDAIAALASPLKTQDGLLRKGRRPFSGYASKVFDLDDPQASHLTYRYRDGLRDGRAEGRNREGDRVYGAIYRKGEIVPGSERYVGKGEKEDFLNLASSALVKVHYQPAPPSRSHWLGTTAQGFDVVSYLYGGLQANFMAALVYIPLVYAIGVTIGLLMGYFGGVFDLVVQRLIEVLSNVPFLFVVMIISLSVPPVLKEQQGLWIIVAILVAFGWMGMTYLMRTAALKEKSRDYIAAARVMGASTPRILGKHLLPNAVSIVVTLVPFSVSSLVMSLAALDYLGFGVPSRYATWGQLLREGLENLSASWLASTAFLALVILLILVTFVGEAVREAFDPKKFSFYK